ncbi:hypothetical protein P3T37_005007 [Kitasatospora sp. MAA4]|uniref:hypothetical protein n=1 Tax=Kitasatospora sp. MAA4 TaxID=3035093 RepID=UPI002474606E|nr:hypothetical protein [Kitasatospora sp. MAA4]MDH6135591.1 hypothetical protein [Kitasatospora sp. MAA4]
MGDGSRSGRRPPPACLDRLIGRRGLARGERRESGGLADRSGGIDWAAADTESYRPLAAGLLALALAEQLDLHERLIA